MSCKRKECEEEWTLDGKTAEQYNLGKILKHDTKLKETHDNEGGGEAFARSRRCLFGWNEPHEEHEVRI